MSVSADKDRQLSGNNGAALEEAVENISTESQKVVENFLKTLLGLPVLPADKFPKNKGGKVLFPSERKKLEE